MNRKLRVKIKIDRLLFWFSKFLTNNKGWLWSLAGAFFLGRVINEFSLPNTNMWDISKGIFGIVNRPANFVSWLSVAFLVSIPLLHYFLKKFHTHKRYAKLLAANAKIPRAKAVVPYKHLLAWGDELSLQDCPNRHRGWRVLEGSSEIKILHDTREFIMPAEYEQAYEDYFKKFYKEKGFSNDGKKFMLTWRSASSSGDPTLSLDVIETRYSQVQFYKDNVATKISKRDELIRKAVEGSIEFPHSLCLHAVIVTSDDKVVITKRDFAVSYFPGLWSCTAEEGLDLKDFRDAENSVVSKWVKRFLSEEFSLGAKDYNDRNVKILSVFLEGDILNISLCAHVILNIPALELNQKLFLRLRPDIESGESDVEFSEWAFLTHDEIFYELFHANPTRDYHPSSRYRMFLALIKRYGEPAVYEKILNQVS